MNLTIDIQNRKELKQQFFLKYQHVFKDYAEEMIDFILDNIKLSLTEQKTEQELMHNNISESAAQTVTNENYDFNSVFEEIQNNNTNTTNFTNEDIIRFVYEITGALKDRIHRNNIVLFGDGKNDSNNLQATARYRETYRLGLNYKNDVSTLIPRGSYEDAILLGNFFVSTIFNYDDNFHEFHGGQRRDIIAPNVPETQLLYGDALCSTEEYKEILCSKLRNILNLELDNARIFFNDELTRILSEKRINI